MSRTWNKVPTQAAKVDMIWTPARTQLGEQLPVGVNVGRSPFPITKTRQQNFMPVPELAPILANQYPQVKMLEQTGAMPAPPSSRTTSKVIAQVGQATYAISRDQDLRRMNGVPQPRVEAAWRPKNFVFDII